MGIPKYHKWLTERYPNAFAEAHAEKADHVYVDINAQLHDCMRHAANEDAFFAHLFTKLDGLFRTVVPVKSIFLAIDGPASCAKCLTQRQRRREHAQKDAKQGSRGSKGKGKKGGKFGGAQEMSNNMLTPGVPFMTKLTSALEYYVAGRMAAGQPFARCASCTVSGAHAVGEGEHKIVSQMLRLAGASEGAAAESHVIFSGDADIFLLSLVQSACRRVRVVSERPTDGGQKRPRGMMLQIWNAEVLARYLHQELATPGTTRAASDEAAVRRDFAFVSLLAGNDYLPEMKCSLTPQRLWEQYIALRRAKFPSKSIIAASLTAEGLPLSHSEGGWALEVGEVGTAFAAEPYEHFSFFKPFLLEFMRKAAPGSPAASDLAGKPAEGVEKYLQGLLWILEMYHHGYCGDFYFGFEKSLHRFANASLIVQWLSKSRSGPLAPPRSADPPMRPLSCALCILPVQHAEKFLCPSMPSLRPMFTAEHPLLGSVNSIERSDEMKEYKAKVSALQQEMMALRAQGRDDTQVKAQLTHFSQKIQAAKGAVSDIDVVPLREVDAEVAERCAGRGAPTLDFASDVTLARGPGGEPFSLPPPVQRMGPARCNGLLYVTGEWPQLEGELQVATLGDEGGDPTAVDEEADAAEEFEAGDAEQEEDTACGDAAQDEDLAVAEAEEQPAMEDTFVEGDAVEAYWPEDDVWMPATIVTVGIDGSMTIAWDEDGSHSDVPADYVRDPEANLEAPPAKRARF
mmetsp:Transcript_63983/g.187178  ORF Transcript_63983/g.187178 Transcript_63983/m.187178 type:complete len:741 (+) Transcript_63983:82-2304(+)